MNREKIVFAYMKALGDEQLSEETWKRIADVNRDVLDARVYDKWKDEFREYFDKTLKPKKPTMENLDRELCVDFISKLIN